MTAHRFVIRRAAAVAAAATAAVVLAACGAGADGSTAGHSGHGGSSAPAASATASPGEHNSADVSFAQGMIPHHRQAVEMAGLAATRAESSEVKTLVEEIKKAQDPEIATMSEWLTGWGEQVPAEDGGMDHSGHSMSGMMTAEQMDELGQASGKAFDTAFLEMMVMHHEGAVAMAETEKSQGAYQPAKDLADDIITSQTVEITRMNKLLGKN